VTQSSIRKARSTKSLEKVLVCLATPARQNMSTIDVLQHGAPPADEEHRAHGCDNSQRWLLVGQVTSSRSLRLPPSHAISARQWATNHEETW
jgi:hypothetical protein